MKHLNNKMLVLAAVCWMISPLVDAETVTAWSPYSDREHREQWEPNCNWAFHQAHFVACNLNDERAKAVSRYLSTRIDTNQ